MSWSDYRQGEKDARRYAKKDFIDRTWCDIFGGGYGGGKKSGSAKKSYDEGWDYGRKRR